MKRLLTTFLLSYVLAASLRAAETESTNTPNIVVPAPSATSPVWGKLVISGNTVSCYYATGATTPKAWISLGPAQTIDFINNPILVGIYICSHNAAALSTGTIDNLTITPTPKYRLAAT